MGGNRKICVGMIVGAHGIQGQVRLRSFTDDPEAIFGYAPLTDEAGACEYELEQKGVAKDCFIVSVKGVKDRNASEALRGTKLYIDRAVLPKPKKGQYYEADLIGLSARDAQGDSYGVVLGVHDYGAGVFLEIGVTKKDSFMLPFNDAFVPELDMEVRTLVIAPPEGWLDKIAREEADDA